MQKKPTIRGSSLPLLMTCSNAVLNPDNLRFVESANEMADVGTHVHALAETLVNTGSFDLESVKDRMSVQDYDRAGKLMRNFLRLWNEAKKTMTAPKTEFFHEAELSNCIISGHIDLSSMGAKVAYILDYKAGRQHEDHYHQMGAYSFLLWDKAGRPTTYTIHTTVAYLEDLSLHPYTFTASDLVTWEKEIAAQVLQVRYTAGRKCALCPLSSTCPAYRAYFTGAVGIFNDETAFPGTSWEEMTPDQRGELIDKMYAVGRAIDRAKLGLRNLVRSKGSVDISNGKEMTLVEDATLFLDTARALPVLDKRVGRGTVMKYARIPLDEMLTVFSNKAAKGQKIKARSALLEELQAAGAVVRAASTKMFRRPKGEKVME